MDGKRYPQQLFKRGLLYARRGKHGNGYSHECSGLLWRLDFLPEQLRQWGPHECNHSRTQSGALFPWISVPGVFAGMLLIFLPTLRARKNMQCKITLFTAFFVALAIALSPLFQRIGSSFSSFDGIGVPSPGALPCLKAGRVMPVSSAAADSLKLASGRTSVNLGGSRTGPVKWLLALNACPAKWPANLFCVRITGIWSNSLADEAVIFLCRCS